MAAGIDTILAQRMQPASTTLALYPPARPDDFTPVLADTLRRQGFAIAAARTVPAHTLRYVVAPLDSSGDLVRLLIDDREAAAQFFARNAAGHLQPGGAVTITQ